MSKRGLVWVVTLWCAVLIMVACDRPEPPVDTAAGGMRVVTLAPALTKMIIDLGRGDAIVGVPEHDPLAPAGTAVIGNFMNVNTERLFNLRPTHLVMMTGQHGVPPSLAALSRSAGFNLVAYSYPYSVDDVAAVLHNENDDDPNHQSLGAALGMPDEARQLRRRMLTRLAAVGRVTRDTSKPTVLLVIGVEPSIRASAPAQTGTVLDDLLGFAGGRNAAAQSQVSAPVYDREKLLAVAPEVILLLLPNEPPLTDHDSRLDAFVGLDIPAVRDGRITLINDPMVLLPATNLPEAAAALAKVIHPKLSAQIDVALEAP